MSKRFKGWTEKDITKINVVRKLKESKPAKYRNKKVSLGTITFDSKKEYSRYLELMQMQSKNEIQNLQRQVKIPLMVNGKPIANYIADFVYDKNGIEIVEDVKSEVTKKTPNIPIKEKNTCCK